MTKHLRALVRAGLVRCVRVGRERRFALQPEPIDELQEYLGTVSRQWDDALSRFEKLVED